jgi:hypothetical protein
VLDEGGAPVRLALIFTKMKIEILYFEDCPSWQTGLENLKVALAEENMDAEVNQILVQSNADAAREKFLGSPSFRMNGIDLWPEERKKYYLGCRVYNTVEGLKGFPSVAMLREKIREASSVQLND